MNRPPRPQAAPLFAAVEIDQFAAQAVAARREQFRGRAFAVIRQRQESHRAAVYACSPAARELGVRPGTPVFAMKRNFGGMVAVVERHEADEKCVLDHLAKAMGRWTPEYAADGPGRFLLDLAGTPACRTLTLPRVGEELAGHLRRRTGLQEIAVAVCRSRMLVKQLVRQAVPDGVRVCLPQDEEQLLRSLDLDALPLPTAVREGARRYGLHGAAQIMDLGRAALRKRFGVAEGERLYGLVRGLDSAPRDATRGLTIDAETTLGRDINDAAALRQAARLTADKLVDRLRRGGFVARRLTLQLRYTDNRSAQCSRLLSAATDEFGSLAGTAVQLFEELNQRRVAIKTIRLWLTRPSRDSGQLDLLAGIRERKSRSLGLAITEIRERLGFDALMSGDTCPGQRSG